MPDDTDARGAEASAAHADKNSPDLVGEELGDGARIWRVYDRVARDEDRERVGHWNRGLDNLALFAGLFSAVTTAFIIQLQQDTEPDYPRLTFLVLNATAAGVAFREEHFAIDPRVRTTNCLWISSLMLSLSAALIAIMGKDWIGMYTSRPVCNPRQWAEIRTYRVGCVERWYMSGVIASAPVLLHISLVLFAVGLVIFVDRDPFSQRVALGLALAAGGLYLVTVLSAIVFPTSPFKSPATQAIRAALGSLCALVYSGVVYHPRPHPVRMLQQATLIISALLSHPLPANILPVDQSLRRGLREGDIRLFWDRLFSLNSPNQRRRWKDTVILFARAFRAHSAALVLSFRVFLRSALEDYRYRHQRPRPRPWNVSAISYLRRIDLSDRWAEARSQPTPVLMAQSLSQLNAMTPSSDVFRSILIALGDIAIGRQVAPLVSLDLNSKLSTEILHNWRKADMMTLAHYILVDGHLSDHPMMPRLGVSDRFIAKNGAIKSERIVFALVELDRTNFVPGGTVIQYIPDIVIQPRALHYLLPVVHDTQVLVVLAYRYWDPCDDDRSMSLEGELRQRLTSLLPGDRVQIELTRRSIGRFRLIGLLVFLLIYLDTDILTIACAVLLKAYTGKFSIGERHYLIYAFGHNMPRISSAAWAALPAQKPGDPYYLGFTYLNLENSLPLDHIVPRDWRERVPLPAADADRNHTFDICLARTIVRLLYPSRFFYNNLERIRTSESGYLSTLDACVVCLRRHLSDSPSALDGDQQFEIITALLENSVLIRLSAVWKYNMWKYEMPFGVLPRTERHVPETWFINILIAIARQLTTLLASGRADDNETGARLFCLFSFSEVTDSAGRIVAWDLGQCLLAIADHPLHEGPSTKTRMRRLLSAIRALRPFCVRREDMRAAWDGIGLAANDEYQDPFWDAEHFELGGFLALDLPSAGMEGVSDGEDTVGHGSVAGVPEDSVALHWLDAAMR